MGKTQAQYLIRANSRCKTHPEGTEIVYTGPRNAVSPGWTIIKRIDKFARG